MNNNYSNNINDIGFIKKEDLDDFNEQDFDNEHLNIKLASICFFIVNSANYSNLKDIDTAKRILNSWEVDLGNHQVIQKTISDITNLPKLFKFKLNYSKNFINSYNQTIDYINSKVNSYYNSSNNINNCNSSNNINNINNNSSINNSINNSIDINRLVSHQQIQIDNYKRQIEIYKKQLDTQVINQKQHQQHESPHNHSSKKYRSFKNNINSKPRINKTNNINNIYNIKITINNYKNINYNKFNQIKRCINNNSRFNSTSNRYVFYNNKLTR